MYRGALKMSSAEKIAAGACIYVCIYASITSIYVPTYITCLHISCVYIYHEGPS